MLHWLERPAVIIALATWFCVSAQPASAQADPQSAVEATSPATSSDYDAILDRAVQAFDAQDYAKARSLFERAYALRPNARVLRGLGISALHLERFSTSKRELTEALRETKQPLTPSQRDGVKDLLRWMEQNLGELRLQVRPPEARITLNGSAVAESELVVQPGTHRVGAGADGYVAEERTVELAAGQEKTLQLKLSRQPEDRVAEALLTPSEVAVNAESQRQTSVEPTTPAVPLVHEPHEADHGDEPSVLERWWFWTAVGVVVAGGVAATVALSSSAPDKEYERGGLGGVIMPLERMP